jgi:hypothetical protein
MPHIVKRTIQQNRVLHTILNAMRVPEDVKRDLIFQFSNGRTQTSVEISSEECQALINHLNVLQGHPKAEANASLRGERPKAEANASLWGEREISDRMRKKILSICHEMRMQKEGSTKIDMARVNKLCCERGYLHKDLDKYTRAELPMLITQFERMLRDYLKGGNHAG